MADTGLVKRGTLKLGLIGDNIARSRSPLLHQMAGLQNDLAVSYERLVPLDMGQDFGTVFTQCSQQGYRGVNITYPYKEIAAELVRIRDPLVKAIGAVNTVIFDEGGALGYNTDYSGFVRAYRRTLGKAETGPVLVIGTGGVGRAVAFGLIDLGTKELRLVDRDRAKAELLAQALKTVAPDLEITIDNDAVHAAQGARGLINCTPIGMIGYDGTPLPVEAMSGAGWAFDAVYTPVHTQFLQDAEKNNLSILSGWELFFYQGVDAWGYFSGLPLDEAELRQGLLHSEAN